MTPQKQTVFGDGKGNCWATCIAAILDMAVGDVPNFCGEPERNPEWYDQTDRWLQRFGYRVVGFTFADNAALPIGERIGIAVQPGTYLIVSGKSPRGDFYHSVVAEYVGDGKWEVVCDPHPSGAGLDGPWVGVDMIVASSRRVA